MVDAKLEAVISDKFAKNGGRRLMGLVNIDYSILVALPMLNITLLKFRRANYQYVSNLLATAVHRKGRPDLTGSIFVQSVTAVWDRGSTTTTIQKIDCPKGALCISASCGSCWKMGETDGLECQELATHVFGECICACFQLSGINTTTSSPDVGLTSGVSPSRLHVGAFTVALVALYLPVFRESLLSLSDSLIQTCPHSAEP